MDIKFKLITSNDPDMFAERLERFTAALGLDDIIVDIQFSTTTLDSGRVEFSALIQYKETQGWTD